MAEGDKEVKVHPVNVLEVAAAPGVQVKKLPGPVETLAGVQSGTYRIQEFDREGNLVNDTGDHNAVLSSAPILLAAMLANDAGSGVQFFAFGDGDPGWGASPPEPEWEDTGLLAEYYRQAPDGGVGVYLTTEGEVSVPRTTSVRFTCTLDYGLEGELPNGRTFREFGLTGGDATATLGTGLFVDAIRPPPQPKTHNNRLVLTITLLL